MEVFSADPKRLVTMLFDAAYRFMLQGREALVQSNYEDQANYIIRAQNIYVELICTLDEEAGGQLAVNLKRLYLYVHELLRRACVDDDLDKLDEAIAITEKLCAAWREAEAKCRTSQT